MYKIIIYGVYAIEMRRQIEHFLDDEYDIIGYSDAYLEEDIVDGKRFIPVEEICKSGYDYVVLAIVKEKDAVTNMLGLYDVPPEKIVFPEMLCWSNTAKFQRNIIHEIDVCKNVDFEAVIFGLSYSRRGIIQKKLALNCFNYSCPGMDIYYNVKLYRYTRTNRSDLIDNIRYALWVMPYYYFDYDQSISLSQYTSGQICHMTKLGDWHNASRNPQTKRYIDAFNMFANKVLLFYDSPASQVVRKVWDGESRGTLMGNWNRCFQETCDENINILRDTVDELKERGCKVFFIVPPMYVEGMNPVSKKAFYEKQKYFKEICNKFFFDVDIWDYSEEYLDQKAYFDTLDHLNIYGARDFTEKLNGRIEAMHK